ncbi:MAG TPA: T9SS type A sorting domain-containing protein, partial [Bacteroidia bacterium]|nr:T9SS type A sorting domain-containing protein [Bacteroidia bacterium]
MKKIYLLLLLLPLFSLKAQVPTCSVDPSFTAEGIWPDSATNFMSGTVGVAYAQNVTIRIPKDTVVSGTTYTYSTVNLQAPTNNYGLPPGLSLTGTPSNYKFPGNASSCMEIYGTPTTAGTYPLTFVLKVYTVNLGSLIPVTTYTVGYYKITINAAGSGIEANKNYDFNVMQNSPNPVVNSTVIHFTSATDGKAKMSVYNITGQKVAEKEFTTLHGDNSYEFDATTLESGIYVYAIELNGQKQIRRMVVAK